MAPFLLRGLTWAMLYVWTKNYPQVVGTCSGHHGQLISQNCVLTKIRAEPPPLILNVYWLLNPYFENFELLLRIANVSKYYAYLINKTGPIEKY